MKKLLSLFLLFLLTLSVSAQMQRGMKGSYILDSFPVVSFVWNTANTEEMSPSQFVLYEGEKPIDSLKIEVLPIDNSTPVNKSILILWEDMASHGRQSEFTREMLTRFFNEVSIASTDDFNVAVFDRQKDSERNIIKPLLKQFTSDGKGLVKAIASYKNNSRTYSSYPQSTDLYSAINEAIDLLPSNRAGVIIVVTEGLNMKASGASTDMETVREKAFRAGIPIYVVKYPLAGNTPEVNILAESTFGKLVSSTTDIAAATNSLKKCYSDIDSRLRGRDYKFTFTASCERDGRPHPMRLTVDKMRRPLPPFISPSKTFIQWLVEYWWLAAIIVLVIVGGVVLIFLSSEKKKKAQEQANQNMQEQFRLQQEETERRSREMLEDIRREQEDRERSALAESERAKREAEEERLVKLMQAKNLFPRLQCKAGTEAFSYTIGKPRTTLGRDASNDVTFSTSNDAFNNQTVSGLHAEIVFNGTSFEVINKSHTYSQGIIVNGQFYQQYTLRSGDMIGLGEAIVTFYL